MLYNPDAVIQKITDALEALPSISSLPFREGPGVGSTGLLFESDNSDELAKKMLWALEHPAEVHTIITNAQADVQKYAWEIIKKELFKIYKS